MLGKGIFGLYRQRDTIHQEQHAGNGVGLKQPLDKCRRHAGFAGSGCHFNQQLAPPLGDFTGQGMNAVRLIQILSPRDMGQSART